MKDTICAVATPVVKSAISVIRISGSHAFTALKNITIKKNFITRQAILCNIIDPNDNSLIDKALVFCFKGPNSFSGEDIVEIHCHGSVAVINKILSLIISFENIRLAEPGEFSKRAFYNNKMDLTEAEGLADLIESETYAQLQQALRQFSGKLKDKFEDYRKNLIRIMAYLEAYIDFPDEEIPQEVITEVENNVLSLKNEIYTYLNDNRRGEILRHGINIAIIGAPNSGKSSLINLLSDKQISIVSAIKGTTRDVVEIKLDLGGFPFIIADTAGLRKSKQSIEQEGIRRAYEKAKDADIIIALFDATSKKPDIHTLELLNEKSIILINKCDQEIKLDLSSLKNRDYLLFSTLNRENYNQLVDKIIDFAKTNFNYNSHYLITRNRHRQLLNEVFNNLDRFDLNMELEIAAEYLRSSANALGKLTGIIHVEDILDKLFGSFCIGK